MHINFRKNSGNTCGVFFMCCITMAGLFGCCLPGLAQAMEQISDLPGNSEGKTRFVWIAPYVVSNELTIGKATTSSIVWFDEKGKVLRTVVDGTPQPGFVYSADQKTLCGLNGNWQIELPKRKSFNESIASSEDSQTLIHQLPLDDNQLSLDVFVRGELVNTLGPYESYKGREAHVGDDGSAALPIWENNAKKNAQVVVLGPDGKLSFRVNVDQPIDNQYAAPGGDGALLFSNRDNRFIWYTEQGKQRSLDAGPNGMFLEWVPGSHQALMTTSLGDEYRYRLVDWDTGKLDWDITCPGNGHVLAVTLTTEYALFAIGELYTPGAWSGESWFSKNRKDEWIQVFYAVRLEDGKVTGYWRARYPKRYCGPLDDGFFAQRDKGLYYVTPKEFVLIDPADIGTRKKGWGDPPVPVEKDVK